jgi:hypothetical protein
MKKSRLLIIYPRSKSETIFNIDSPGPVSKKLKNDPFQTLHRSGSNKLQPVSPSGSRLPSLQSKPAVPEAIDGRVKVKMNQLPHFELVFKPNRLKVAPKDMSKPKTPYFRIRRRETTQGKEPQTTRNKINGLNVEDVSFG